MRRSSRILAFLLCGVGSVLAWISGCSDLEDDCELLVNCPRTEEPPKCSVPLISPACTACLQANCCQEVSDCSEDFSCINDCVRTILPPLSVCNSGLTGEVFGRLTSCLRTKCPQECGGSSYCNPVTHAGCQPDGSQCEFFYPGIFDCIPPFGTPAQICQSCNFTNGPYCGSGLRCDVTSLQCARYCCSDADCGTGHCELNQDLVFGFGTANPTDRVGLCLANAPATGPACDAAGIPPPSNGTCFTGFEF